MPSGFLLSAACSSSLVHTILTGEHLGSGMKLIASDAEGNADVAELGADIVVEFGVVVRGAFCSRDA
jgi:hypothetical protein